MADTAKNDLSLLNGGWQPDIGQEARLFSLKARDIQNPMALATDEMVVPLLGVLVERATRTSVGHHQDASGREVPYDFKNRAPRDTFPPFGQELVNIIGRAVTAEIGQGLQDDQPALCRLEPSGSQHV